MFSPSKHRFGSGKKMSPKIILGQKKILVWKKNFVHKKFGFEKILVGKKCWVWKKIWVKKFLDQKKFLAWKKFCVRKKILVKKILGPKKFVVVLLLLVTWTPNPLNSATSPWVVYASNFSLLVHPHLIDFGGGFFLLFFFLWQG